MNSRTFWSSVTEIYRDVTQLIDAVFRADSTTLPWSLRMAFEKGWTFNGSQYRTHFDVVGRSEGVTNKLGFKVHMFQLELCLLEYRVRWAILSA